ncbi:MAG: hypothetical protein E7Z72_01400 [Methanocorpusculum parvum]|nr:hypothetical protein [Methanocorpusculum parvum]
MKKLIPIILIVLLFCVGFAIFAGANGFWQTPNVPDADEDEYPYPISFLKIDAVDNPDSSFEVIPLTEADREKYPVLIGALENEDTYLNIHPSGEMTPEEYYSIYDHEWETYFSFDGKMYHVALGPIGLAPPMP